MIVDSIVLIKNDTVFIKSSAVLEILKRFANRVEALSRWNNNTDVYTRLVI